MPYSAREGPCTLRAVVGVLLICAFLAAQDASAPNAATDALQARHLLGLEGVRDNDKGRLMIGSDGLDFSSGAGNAQIPIASIEDVFTGKDSRQTGGKAMTVTQLAVPYGGGRVLSLFTKEKFDTLTVEYRDTDGGLHAAIFRLPRGQGAAEKKQLIAMGARESVAQQVNTAAVPKPNVPTAAYAVQIEPVTAGEGELPAEFAMAIYENLVAEVTKTGKFAQVFRSGDRRATEAPNLLILTSTLERFQHGSETKRAVTTVAGATRITVDARLATRDSQVKFEHTVQGKVRLFGENLKATQSLAKNIARLISESSLQSH